jgi:hypothetical protein
MLLTLWERGLGVAGLARAEAVLASAGHASPPRSLGERNRRLLELHASLFGPYVELRSLCPGCATAVEWSADCDALLGETAVEREAPTHRLDSGGYRVEFRLADGADLMAAARDNRDNGDRDEEAFARALLRRCVVSCSEGGAPRDASTLPDSVLDALSIRMETLDPAARFSFALDCPECGARWDARLEVDELLWVKVQAAAERLLLEVDALARAYGWTEHEVLALSPLRRAAYLQMAGG